MNESTLETAIVTTFNYKSGDVNVSLSVNTTKPAEVANLIACLEAAISDIKKYQ